MYKFYIVPDATECKSHSEIYTKMELFYDPYAESDAYALIEPTMKEELNKSGSLEFTILPANIHYNDFHKRKTMVIVFDESTWLYEGVVTDAPVDFYKQRKVTCIGPLAFLCDSIQAPDEKNVIVIPTSAGETSYYAVPDAWLSGANPKSMNWYVQSIGADGSITYVKTKDTVVVSGTRYFYPVASDGANYSGTTTTKAAATEETISAHIERLLNVHNSQVDEFKRIFIGKMYNSSDTKTHEFKSSGYRTTWDALKSDILDDYGKYFTITRGDDNNLYLNYIELAQLPTSDSIPLIEFTNNMIEMNQSDNSDDDIFTVLVPIGKDGLTVKDVTGHDSPADDTKEVSPYIKSWGGNKRYVVVGNGAVERYGYIVKTQSFSDISNKDTLYTRAVTYIQNNYDYHDEYEVKAIDLRFIDGSSHRICVGDKCHLRSKWHGLNTSALYVISAEHNIANPENDSYRIGIPTSDREANNRTLTGQSQDAKSKSAASEASTNSALSRMNSILEDYIHVTEWGLEMNSKLKNEVVSNDGKYTTRFTQNEESINIAAQKLFGIDEDGRGDVDAGYVKVPKSEYRKTNDGPYKNPTNEHWFEKDKSGYVLSTDTTCDPSEVGDKDYYWQRLWSRYSNIDVGVGGIKATVDGNYERSTYCSSWLQANEESLLALVGHIHVDENGQVIVDGGVGLRTGTVSDRVDVHYEAVPRVSYSGSVPVTKGWYERVLDSSGKWTGEGVAESEIMKSATPATLGPNEAKYYKKSFDAEAKSSKYYYVRQSVREEFTAEYGVYDENTLQGGIIARMVNYPQYTLVPQDEVKKKASEGAIANELGWYVYNSSEGTFGLALAGEPVYPIMKYYTYSNTAQYTTDIYGQHIVIGKVEETTYVVVPKSEYSTSSPYLSKWYEKTDSGGYVLSNDYHAHNDKTYYRKHIGYGEMDEKTKARVDKYIADNNLNGTITEIASDVVVVNALIAKYIEADDITANTSLWTDYFHANHASINDIYSPKIVADDIWWRGNSDHDPSDTNSLKHNTIMIFATEDDENKTLTASVSGDDVTISFMTMDAVTRSVTFTKPASLGTVTWSSGENKLTMETVGGNKFFEGNIRVYQPNNASEVALRDNAEYLEAETSGYSTVYGLYYTRKNQATGNLINSKVLMFKTPKNRYGDAVSTIRTYAHGSADYVDGDDVYIGVNGSIRVRAQYKTEKNYDDEVDSYENRTGINVHGSEVRIYANHDDHDYLNGSTITLGSDDMVSVKVQSRLNSEDEWSNYRSLTVKSAKAQTASGYTAASYKNVSYDDGDEITLDYSDSVKVYGRFKLSGSNDYTDCAGITVKSKANNSQSFDANNIILGTIGYQEAEPTNATLLSALREDCLNAINDSKKKWVYFTVSISKNNSVLATKKYKMNFGS